MFGLVAEPWCMAQLRSPHFTNITMEHDGLQHEIVKHSYTYPSYTFSDDMILNLYLCMVTV